MPGDARLDIPELLQIIDAAFDKKSWHGPNLRGSIKGLEMGAARYRPAPQRHNIWEIVVHAAYWKYVVRRRLVSEKRGSFPLKGSNWFRRPAEPDVRTWQEDIALLQDMHQTLRAAIAGLEPKDLSWAPPGSKVSNLHLITGIAAHDVYHAGQIQLLKRLASGDGKDR
jgi:hypothetical protein